MDLKSKEARFIFVPEVQSVSTVFTYNFFEKDERENISDRYRTIKNINRLTTSSNSAQRKRYTNSKKCKKANRRR
jgi:predicted nucleotide-binding protein (sugar kinase/HSP70/actin superfamily)